jgi:hypothetical protein
MNATHRIDSFQMSTVGIPRSAQTTIMTKWNRTRLRGCGSGSLTR